MPMEIMPIIEKMAVLVLLMLIGFCCAKLGLTNAAFNQKVTPVVMNVLLVATILNSVVSAETVAGGIVLLEYFAAFAAMFFISFLVAWGFARLLRRDRDDESVLRLTMMFPNNAFVGFPVVAAVFGEQAVFYAAISNIPFNILLYTLGTAQLRRTGTGRIAWKQIFTAPLIATFAAAALYLTHLPVPHVIGETISVPAMPPTCSSTSTGLRPIQREITPIISRPPRPIPPAVMAPPDIPRRSSTLVLCLLPSSLMVCRILIAQI